MNLFKRIALSVFALMLLNTANAATDMGDFGDVTDGSISTVDTTTIISGQGTVFSHYWTFNFDPDQSVYGFLVDSLSETTDGEVTVAIDPLKINLYRTVSAADDTIVGSAVESWVLNSGQTQSYNGVLSAGSYRLDFDGEVTGTQYGNYAFSGEFTSAVPEPSTYALMLAGLGLIGFMARRKVA